jgi:hypothetical protein
MCRSIAALDVPGMGRRVLNGEAYGVIPMCLAAIR